MLHHPCLPEGNDRGSLDAGHAFDFVSGANGVARVSRVFGEVI